ncbi:MAG: dipeptide ABC transporter ATP-binding protein [Chloroflexota bacterium]|nr:dipeptide ABC transporter ATP-binding protein [Chloroflexota bacterium]
MVTEPPTREQSVGPIVAAEAPQRPVLLDVRDLKKYFAIQRGLLRRVVGHVKAVDGVSFVIHEGETLGLVGESGSGKTTTGRIILRAGKPTGGQVLFRHAGNMVDLTLLSRPALKPYRKEMQVIFQDPFSSLDPRMTVFDIVSEPLVVHRAAQGNELRTRVRELLELVGLRAQHMNRYPNAFSGGQRQRIGIARALALRPKLVVCDEPVSALDVSIQAQVLNLLKDLQNEFRLAYLFIAHDLSVVEHISDRVAVMYLGKIVELAPAEQMYRDPKHPYTEALLSAIPKSSPRQQKQRIVLPGDVPNPADPPPGCAFHTRCRYARDICKLETPPLRSVADSHVAACHFADELQLAGVE